MYSVWCMTSGHWALTNQLLRTTPLHVRKLSSRTQHMKQCSAKEIPVAPGCHGYRTVFILMWGREKQKTDRRQRMCPRSGTTLLSLPNHLSFILLPSCISFPLLPCFLALSSLPFPYTYILIKLMCTISPHHRMTFMKQVKGRCSQQHTTPAVGPLLPPHQFQDTSIREAGTGYMQVQSAVQYMKVTL